MYYGEIKNCDIANGDGRAGDRCSFRAAPTTASSAFSPKPGILTMGSRLPRQTEETAACAAGAVLYRRADAAWAASPSSRRTSGRCCPFCAGCARGIRKRPSGPFPALRWRSCNAGQPCPLRGDGAACWRCIDVLVDGRFILAQRDISLRFRGSQKPAPDRFEPDQGRGPRGALGRTDPTLKRAVGLFFLSPFTLAQEGKGAVHTGGCWFRP